MRRRRLPERPHRPRHVKGTCPADTVTHGGPCGGWVAPGFTHCHAHASEAEHERERQRQAAAFFAYLNSDLRRLA